MSRFRIVWSIPVRPASPMWLLASDTQSRPASTSPLMYLGLAEKTVPLPWKRKAFGAGFSKLAIAMSAPLMRSRTAPVLPVRFVYGRSQPIRRAVLAAPRDLHRAAVEREVRAPLAALDRERDAAVEQDVAAGDHGPGGRRVVGGRRGTGEPGDERPRREALDPVDAEQGLAAPGERPHGRADLVGPQERERASGWRRGSGRASPADATVTSALAQVLARSGPGPRGSRRRPRSRGRGP